MNRICPNCQKNLYDNESYFCHSCGHKLGDDLINFSSSFQIKQTLLSSHEKEKNEVRLNLHLNAKLVLAFVLVLLTASFSVMTIIFAQNKLEEKQEVAAPPTVQEVQEESYGNVVAYDLKQPSIGFDAGSLTKYVPFEVDFYLLGSDLASSYGVFWGEIDPEGILNNFKDYLSERYIIFGQKIDDEWQVAVVLFMDELANEVVNDEFLESLESDEYFVQKVEYALVITKYEPFVTKVEETSSDISKNVSHNPKYNSYKTQLPKEGQLLFMSFDNFEEIYDFMLAFSPSNDLLPLLNEVKDKQFNKFVVVNNE